MSSPETEGPPPQPPSGWLRRAVFRFVRALMPFVARLEGRTAQHEERLRGIERGLSDLSREALPALLERLQRLGNESRAAAEAAQLLAERVRADAERQAGDEARLGVQAASLARQGALLAELAARLDAAEASLGETARTAADGLERHREEAFSRLEAERVGRILATTARVRVTPPSPTLVSVILATRDRAPLLAEALRSVRAQSHERWELILVDDGASAATRTLLEEQHDPRVRVLHSSGIGAPAARNRGLDAAQGAVVAYLDDDNLMDPDWLRAVAWAFDAYPESQVLYGAQVAEDEASRSGPLEGRYWVRFEAWDRARLERENFVDLSALAHRRIPEARFDESLARLEDWDLLLRLTRERPPLRLPVLAGVYRAEPIPRVSNREPVEPARAAILAKLRTEPAGRPNGQ